VSRLVAIDLEDGSWKYIASEEVANQLQFDHLVRLDDSRVLGVFSGSLNTESLWILDVENPMANKIIRKSQEHQISDSWFSRPELLGVSSKGSPARTVYGFLWMPRNPHWTAEDGALPPLIIATHGGPTGHYGPGLNLRTQYFTSRGYAVFFLNYHGSTGHGRAYRQALWGNWGTIDSDDAVEVADYLVSAGRVRKGSIGCTGLSAGGYHTLTSVTRHPHVYAGAVDVSGICDLVTFNNGTHKLEWNYADALVVDRDDATEEEKVARYRERSALYHTDKIETPLLILHGKEDTVVPMNQATDVYEALKNQGKDVKLVKVDNDGHVLAKPRSAKIWLDEEEKWWRKTLV
jgi:dipeptidyl aminopeptidase/acylaminoacyl peptidase